MRRFLKYLLICLTVFAVGAAQLVGANASYYCECTGQKTVLEACESSCHPGADHHGDCSGNPAEHRHDSEDSLPDGPEHEHDKVLEKLVGTPTPTLLHSPAVVWIAVLTDPFPVLVFCGHGTAWPAAFETKPPERNFLPDRIGTARTTVMLV